jgi:hypothetical protein
MDAEQAIHSFLSSFGVPAYDDNSVPDTAELPYITYSISYDSFDNDVAMNASLWARTISWEWLTSKAKEITDTYKNNGVKLPTDNGVVWLKGGSPIYQRMGNEDKNIKRIYFSISCEYQEI